jgi:hypothetical protein
MKLSVKSKLALTALLELALQPDTPAAGRQLQNGSGSARSTRWRQNHDATAPFPACQRPKASRAATSWPPGQVIVTAAQILELTERRCSRPNRPSQAIWQGKVLDQLLAVSARP